MGIAIETKANLKVKKCCANCKFFVFGNGRMLDGMPMHCEHPQFRKPEYKSCYYITNINVSTIFQEKVFAVRPYNYCKNWNPK